MSQAHYQTKSCNKASDESPVWKCKLVLVSALLLVVVVLTSIAMPFQVATPHATSVSSPAQSIIIRSTPGGGVCNPGPNC